DEGWRFADVFANKEKCGFGVVAVEEIEEFGSDGGVRPVVEGEREFARLIGLINGVAKKLGAGVQRTIAGEASQAGGDSGGGDEPGLHGEYSATKMRAGLLNLLLHRGSRACLLKIAGTPIRRLAFR